MEIKFATNSWYDLIIFKVWNEVAQFLFSWTRPDQTMKRAKCPSGHHRRLRRLERRRVTECSSNQRRDMFRRQINSILWDLIAFLCSQPVARTKRQLSENPWRGFHSSFHVLKTKSEFYFFSRSTRKKCEEAQVEYWQQQQRERQRRNRLRALRLDPAWVQVRGGEQALEDIAFRRCYKQGVERERLIQYHMDREEMMNRVWQMPPLFDRQASVIDFFTLLAAELDLIKLNLFQFNA